MRLGINYAAAGTFYQPDRSECCRWNFIIVTQRGYGRKRLILIINTVSAAIVQLIYSLHKEMRKEHSGGGGGGKKKVSEKATPEKEGREKKLYK